MPEPVELPPGAMLVMNDINGAIGLTMPDGETYVLGTFRKGMDLPRFVQRAVEAWIG